MENGTLNQFTELQFVEKQVAGYSYNDCLVSLLNLPDENTHLRVNHFIKDIIIDEVYGDSEDPERFNTLFIPLPRDVDVVFQLHFVKLYHNQTGPLTIIDGFISTNPITHVELYVGTIQKVQDVTWGEPITLPVFVAQFSSVYLRVQYANNLDLTELGRVELELDVGFVQTRVRNTLFRDIHQSAKWSIEHGLLKPRDSFVKKNVKTSVLSRRPIHWLPNGKIKILSTSSNWCVCNYRNVVVEADVEGYYHHTSVHSGENFSGLKMQKRQVNNDNNDIGSCVNQLETFAVVYILKDE